MLLINPVLGSLSDVTGRRPAILLSLALSCVPALVFVCLVRIPTMHPLWYYVRVFLAPYSATQQTPHSQ
jgi:MFS family permease